MPRKPDLRMIDCVVKELGISRELRRLLHDEMAKRKLDQDLSEDEVREIAKEIQCLYPNK